MNGSEASISYVGNDEDVARMLFSPIFIDKGKLSLTAFSLRVFGSQPETYISVLRTSFDCFMADAHSIKPPESNAIFGYALLSVKEVRELHIIDDIRLDVIPRGNGKLKSHAGIFATIGKKLIKGGQRHPSILRIQNALMKIAEKNVVKLP
jgi:hypothetical protein